MWTYTILVTALAVAPVGRPAHVAAEARRLFVAQQFDQARQRAQQAVELFEASAERGSLAHAGALTDLGVMTVVSGAAEKGDALVRAAVKMGEQVAGQDSPALAPLLAGLGQVLYLRGELLRAEPVLRRVLALREREGGQLGITSALHALLALETRLGGYARALEYLSRIEALDALHLPPHHPDHLASMVLKVNLHSAKKDFPRVEAELALWLDPVREVFGEQSLEYATLLRCRAQVLLARRDQQAAEPLLETQLAIRRRALGEGHPLLEEDTATLADIQRKLRRKR